MRPNRKLSATGLARRLTGRLCRRGGRPNGNRHYTFQGGNDGYYPEFTPLILDAAGNLYGTTNNGGGDACSGSYPGCGMIFQLAPPAEPGGAWTENVIWQFQGGADGGYPGGLFVQNGTLIGQTSTGGSGTCSNGFGCGYIFELVPPAAPGGSWTKNILYSFPDNEKVCAISTMDAAGNFFGEGGSLFGSICEIKPPGGPGGSWTVTNLYTFKGVLPFLPIGDGAYPNAVTFDSLGNLWGTTSSGGFCQRYEGGQCFGTVFELTPPSQPGGAWTETVVYRFHPIDQATYDGVVFGPSGALYGITETLVFQLNGPFLTPIDTFANSQTDGIAPTGGVVFDAAGNLYGTTGGGGQFNNGTVYKLAPPGNGRGQWTQTTLHSFAGSPDGQNPEGPLTLGPGGVIYGTTQIGGNQGCPFEAGGTGCGTVFQVIP
jgi:uncharacterized repeat protein (TIGR03803 family)